MSSAFHRKGRTMDPHGFSREPMRRNKLKKVKNRTLHSQNMDPKYFKVYPTGTETIFMRPE